MIKNSFYNAFNNKIKLAVTILQIHEQLALYFLESSTEF